MKKLFTVLALATGLMLTGCISDRWLNSDTGYRNDNTGYSQDPPPPPPGDKQNQPTPPDNRGGYNNGYSNNGGYYNGGNYNDNRYRNRPAIGTSVVTLPGNARRITSGGNELYVCNGVMYQPVRSRNGVSYRVVGYQDY